MSYTKLTITHRIGGNKSSIIIPHRMEEKETEPMINPCLPHHVKYSLEFIAEIDDIIKRAQVGKLMQMTFLEMGKVLVFLDCDWNLWFKAKDVADCLQYQNSRDAIIQNVPDLAFYKQKFAKFTDIETKFDNKCVFKKNNWCLSEQGLYCLILRSKLPVAKEKLLPFVAELIKQIRIHKATTFCANCKTKGDLGESEMNMNDQHYFMNSVTGCITYNET